MTPILCALLSLGGTSRPNCSHSLPGTLPRPSLRAENGSLVPQGGAVTFQCRGSEKAEFYRLEKMEGSERKDIKDVLKAEIEVEFSLSSVTWSHAGIYYCRYFHSTCWSESSNPLELVVTGHHDQPWLEAWPSSEVASGQNVTLQCWSKQLYDWSVLYKDGEKAAPISLLSLLPQELFTHTAINETMGERRLYFYHA
uniref:Ig-like domain-containing protein n=1 Tax=Monodelphis domestica TaxID=13616 RepID=F7E1X7_MONDO